MAKPKAQPAPQPQPQPQQYQQPYGNPQYQQGYPQQQYQQPRPRPMNQEKANNNMKAIRMGLYGFAGLCALGAILMFFADFIKASAFGVSVGASAYDLLTNSDATEESPTIYILIAPIILFVVLMIGS